MRRWLGLAPRRNPALEGVAHPDVQFEESDITASNVLLAGFGVLAGIWIAVVLLHFVFNFFAQYRAEVSPPPIPLASERNTLPPAPRIQAAPQMDLREVRAYEDSELHKYGWVDRQKGIVTIPIERAMQLIAARGIPPQKAPPNLQLSIPEAGTRRTGFEGKVDPEPR